MQDVLGMIWQVSVGMLTLLGMMGIFITLSSQKKLDKCREIYWELVAPPESTFTTSALGRPGLRDYVDFLRSRYNLYSLVTNEANENRGLISIMLSFSNILIGGVIALWGIGVIILCFRSKELIEVIVISIVFFACSYILFHFSKILSKLERVADAEGLFEVKDLLDVSRLDTKVNTDKFMRDTLAVHIDLEANPPEVKICLEFSLPFYGFTFRTLIKGYDDSGREIITLNNTKQFEYNPSRPVNKGITHRFKFLLPPTVFSEMKEINIRILYNRYEFTTGRIKRSELNSQVNDNYWNNPNLLMVEHMNEQQLADMFDYEE